MKTKIDINTIARLDDIKDALLNNLHAKELVEFIVDMADDMGTEQEEFYFLLKHNIDSFVAGIDS